MRGMDRGEENAYLTVFLALCLAVILSLFLVLLDGARRNGVRLEAECVADIGLQSILAEYHRELMRQYNLFAIDSSYGTALCSKQNTEAHLRRYLEKNLSYDDIFLSGLFYRDFLSLALEKAELTGVSILTDQKGEVFRRCAVNAVKADVGLGLLEELKGWLQTIEVNGLEEGGKEEEKYARQLEEYEIPEAEIVETEWGILDPVNPTKELEEKKKLGILKLVTQDEEALSHNRIQTQNLVSERIRQDKVNLGNHKLVEQSGLEELAERFLFQEYLLRYMGRYGAEEDEDVLQYQIEYLIAGNAGDIENLKSVANRICLVREAANALYLMNSDMKRQEIKLAAEVICTVVMLPELAPVLEAVILLGWAYAESIYDVQSLLAGGRVPLLKDDDSWHYGLAAALQGDFREKPKEGQGLSYEDYLRIFLMLTDIDTVTERAMNMVEADIRSTVGNQAFRLDGCYAAVEARIEIGSRHGCRYEITRTVSYD